MKLLEEIYVITSVNILHVLQDFDICDFCNMLSDVHRPTSFTISCSTEQHESKCENESQSCVKLWCSDKVDRFCDNVTQSEEYFERINTQSVKQIYPK